MNTTSAEHDRLTIPPTVWDMDAIRSANRVRGLHWFESGSMRFFRSRVGQTVYQGPGGVYFVSSEQFVGSDGRAHARRYTVRRFDPVTAGIETVGEFNRMTASQARTRARQLASGTSTPASSGAGSAEAEV